MRVHPLWAIKVLSTETQTERLLHRWGTVYIYTYFYIYTYIHIYVHLSLWIDGLQSDIKIIAEDMQLFDTLT